MNQARRRIFLLGGTGFIGSALTRRLVADRADTELMMLVHRTGNARALEQVSTVAGSLGGLDLGVVERFQPDTLLHLARMPGRGRWGRLWAALRGARANTRLVRHLARQSPRTHVIYVSGTLVYGDCGDGPADESRPIRPIAFAREYLRAERPWMQAQAENVLPVTILRPAWIIGPTSWFGEIYLTSIRTEGVVPLFGAGRNLMSLVDVEDCAGLVRHAVRAGRPGECYNLYAPGACLTQREFAERLAALTGAKIRQLDEAEVRRRYGPAMLEAVTFSNRCATRHPGFLAGYEFLRPTVDAMLRHNVTAGLGGAGGLSL